MKTPGPFFPRIRGKVGEAFSTETDEKMGYTWEMWVSLTLGEGEGERYQCPNVFETEQLALEDLNKAVQLSVETLQKAVDGKASGHYFDLKDNQLRKFK